MRRNICGMLAQKFRAQLYAKELCLHGFVPCFVCGEHIEAGKESLEHIRPMILGGPRSDPTNLALSHRVCNVKRNSRPLFRLLRGHPYEAVSVRTPAEHVRNGGDDGR